MNTIRIALTAVALSATALAHASEITDFAVPTSMTVSRASVQAEARRQLASNALNSNFAGPSTIVPPASMKTRDEVRKEIVASRARFDVVASNDQIGGM